MTGRRTAVMVLNTQSLILDELDARDSQNEMSICYTRMSKYIELVTGALASRNFAFMMASLVIAALTGTSALSGHIYRPYLPASRVSQPPRMGMNPFDRFRRRKGEAGKEVAEIISDEVAESKAAIRFARAWASAKGPGDFYGSVRYPRSRPPRPPCLSCRRHSGSFTRSHDRR